MNIERINMYIRIRAIIQSFKTNIANLDEQFESMSRFKSELEYGKVYDNYINTLSELSNEIWNMESIFVDTIVLDAISYMIYIHRLKDKQLHSESAIFLITDLLYHKLDTEIWANEEN